MRLHDVRIARIGDMNYLPGQTPVAPGPNGIAVITRDASVVFAPESLESFRGKPVTIGHPPSFVTIDNWDELAKGHIENPHRGAAPYDDFVVSDVLVTKKDAIALADQGCELSCGYDAAHEQIAPGRGRQTKVVGNHLAFLPNGIKGRCGDMCYVGDQDMDIKEPVMSEPKVNAGTALLKRLFGVKDESDVQRILDEAEAAEQTKTVDELKAQVADLQGQVAKLTKDAAHEHKFGDDGKCDCGAKKPTEDSATVDAADVQDLHTRTVSAVEIVSPGFKVPTYDAAGDLTATRDALCGCQKAAMVAAYATEKGKTVIERAFGGKVPKFDKMTADQIEARFFAVADLMGALNSGTLGELLQAGLAQNPMQDAYDATAAADKRSRERWGKDKPAAGAAK